MKHQTFQPIKSQAVIDEEERRAYLHTLILGMAAGFAAGCLLIAGIQVLFGSVM